MLSFTNTDGRKIARVKGGKHDKKFIYLSDTNDDNKFLSKDFFKKHKKMKKKDILKLKQSIKDGREPLDENLKDIFKDAMDDIKNSSRNEIRITDGVLIPLPNKKIVEKIYVSAPSGAGKSTWCGKWLSEFKKIFKKDEIFVFSTIQNDKVLDRHNPIGVDLEALFEDPVEPDETRDSVCVFDDVDTIQDLDIRNIVCSYRDFLLEQGRHFNTRLLITSHLLMDYKATRRILNEATTIVFFPKCGSTHHIKVYLQKYAGLDNTQIKRILKLPSRWVALYKSYPMYILYDKGVYLLSNDDE